ncbi:unnamed protein product, partial [marine sediment metagenome]
MSSFTCNSDEYLDSFLFIIFYEFEERGLKIFGPDKKTAELEGSKVFAKQFMERHKIPTAGCEIAESPEEAAEILDSGKFSFPLVVKADGLAAGKGVIICENLKEAEEAVLAQFLSLTSRVALLSFFFFSLPPLFSLLS